MGFWICSKCGSRLDQPIFTPTTKATTGHDEPITFQQMFNLVDPKRAEQLRALSLSIYQACADYALKQGIIIADTKFEFGLYKGDAILVDEVLTPDSSRFWPANQWTPGQPQLSYDKQFVRDYLEGIGWNKEPPAPSLPDNVVEKTRQKYKEAYRLLVGETF